jgi:hypothetical protein
MITLNMNEASLAHTVKNAALLSPCHNQISRLRAAFCGRWRRCLFDYMRIKRIAIDYVIDFFFRIVIISA